MKLGSISAHTKTRVNDLYSIKEEERKVLFIILSYVQYSSLYIVSFIFMWILQEAVPLPDQLGEAANYIKNLQISLEKIKQKKDCLTGVGKCSSSTMGRLKLPNIEIHVIGLAVEVALITGLDCQFMFSEIVRMFHEEGAEVLRASFSIQAWRDICTRRRSFKDNGEAKENCVQQC
ncbi:transcription factor bHLH162-like isoform X3 [Olea europaea var. sylvestris]|uniref:transcription factor bHLH162-like isoform X3 n=1 Tax=Olea europaea var. sylvestris TaxID=158386 RepID=UPI000C1D22ED|nr:transcription factor bHLH162-like isoform X3 [Olea europaea var. sylvestris]